MRPQMVIPSGDVCETWVGIDVSSSREIVQHVAVADCDVAARTVNLVPRVAPDNGVLGYVLAPFLKERLRPAQGQVALPRELQAVSITNAAFWRSPVSPTFHGRDIFAPVAARLSLGTSPEEFGEVIRSVAVLPELRPYQASADTLVGRIVHIDHFGNLITNVKREDLPTKPFTVELSNRSISGLSPTYEEGEGLLVLIGSSGYLEIALKGGSALDFLGAVVGGEVKIRLGKR